jgi:hypothetical protein
MINKQIVTNKQFIGLVVIFLSFAGILFYFQLISRFVLLILFWLLGTIVAIVFTLKLVDGVTDVIVQTKTKFAEAALKSEISGTSHGGKKNDK